ncbi:MAG TPA: hypothetical protein VMV36_07965 [Ignavibacteriaceae bacterium]|nr:hypothetical protein [Ignavibacteriaceae bacterium]
MIELLFWGFIIYIIFKGVGLFLRFFIPALRDPSNKYNQPNKESKTTSKYKDVQEVDYTEIKSDSEKKKE